MIYTHPKENLECMPFIIVYGPAAYKLLSMGLKVGKSFIVTDADDKSTHPLPFATSA